jgi:hypothetical protein
VKLNHGPSRHAADPDPGARVWTREKSMVDRADASFRSNARAGSSGVPPVSPAGKRSSAAAPTTAPPRAAHAAVESWSSLKTGAHTTACRTGEMPGHAASKDQTSVQPTRSQLLGRPLHAFAQANRASRARQKRQWPSDERNRGRSSDRRTQRVPRSPTARTVVQVRDHFCFSAPRAVSYTRVSI